jgi:hypothetical protein
MAVGGMEVAVGVADMGNVQAHKTIIKLSRNGNTDFLGMANSFLPLHTNN